MIYHGSSTETFSNDFSTTIEVFDLIVHKRVRLDYLGSLSAFAKEHSNQTLASIEEKELLQALRSEIQQLPAKMREILKCELMST